MSWSLWYLKGTEEDETTWESHGGTPEGEAQQDSVFNNWLKEEKRVVKKPGELRGKQECKTRAYVDEGVGNSKSRTVVFVSRGLKSWF